jgi:hypothetical protein
MMVRSTYVEIENKIEQMAQTEMEKFIIGTGFDLGWSMLDCRNDKFMADLVKKLVGDGSDLSRLENYEKNTALVAMKLVLILVEKQALLRLSLVDCAPTDVRTVAWKFGGNCQNGCGSSTVLGQ